MSDYYKEVIDKIKQIDTTELSDNVDQKVKTNISEKQKVYFWTRVYIRDENPKVKIGDEITIKWKLNGEELSTKFMAYGKVGLEKDHDETIINAKLEDDKKILSLMVDSDDINLNEELPFIRSLFKMSYHYEPQIIRRNELVFIHDGDELDYYDVDW